MNTVKKTSLYMGLLFVVYVAQIAAGRVVEGAYTGVSVLPVFLMLAVTVVPFSHALFLVFFFGVGYEVLAPAPFGLPFAGMFAGVLITTNLMYHMKERALGGRFISALGGVVVHAGIVYGGAYYIVRNTALVRIGMWEVGMQILVLLGVVMVLGLTQYIRSGNRGHGYHT